MTLLHRLRLTARRLGIDVRRWPDDSPGDLCFRLLTHHDINMVIDIGANEGQYGKELRDLGYRGQIISFEPYSVAFEELDRKAKFDVLWDTVQCAIGESNGSVELNVSNNSVSSSIMSMLERHIQAAPGSQYIASETVEMVTLDAVLASRVPHRCRVYLKIDAQGYAGHILNGAERSLKDIVGLQVELSLVPLYEGEWLFQEAHEHLQAAGFELKRLEPGFTDPESGQLLQVDAIFYRRHR